MSHINQSVSQSIKMKLFNVHAWNLKLVYKGPLRLSPWYEEKNKCFITYS